MAKKDQIHITPKGTVPPDFDKLLDEESKLTSGNKQTRDEIKAFMARSADSLHQWNHIIQTYSPENLQRLKLPNASQVIEVMIKVSDPAFKFLQDYSKFEKEYETFDTNYKKYLTEQHVTLGKYLKSNQPAIFNIYRTNHKKHCKHLLAELERLHNVSRQLTTERDEVDSQIASVKPS